MKLIIDIEKDYFEIIKHDVAHGNDYRPFELIANGIPLDEWIDKYFDVYMKEGD